MTELLFITAVVNWIVAALAVVAGIYLIRKINDIELLLKVTVVRVDEIEAKAREEGEPVETSGFMVEEGAQDD